MQSIVLERFVVTLLHVKTPALLLHCFKARRDWGSNELPFRNDVCASVNQRDLKRHVDSHRFSDPPNLEKTLLTEPIPPLRNRGHVLQGRLFLVLGVHMLSRSYSLAPTSEGCALANAPMRQLRGGRQCADAETGTAARRKCEPVNSTDKPWLIT